MDIFTTMIFDNRQEFMEHINHLHIKKSKTMSIKKLPLFEDRFWRKDEYADDVSKLIDQAIDWKKLEKGLQNMLGSSTLPGNEFDRITGKLHSPTWDMFNDIQTSLKKRMPSVEMTTVRVDGLKVDMEKIDSSVYHDGEKFWTNLGDNVELVINTFTNYYNMASITDFGTVTFGGPPDDSPLPRLHLPTVNIKGDKEKHIIYRFLKSDVADKPGGSKYFKNLAKYLGSDLTKIMQKTTGTNGSIMAMYFMMKTITFKGRNSVNKALLKSLVPFSDRNGTYESMKNHIIEAKVSGRVWDDNNMFDPEGIKFIGNIMGFSNQQISDLLEVNNNTGWKSRLFK